MDGKVKIVLPEIAENGNTVPVKVAVESPMTADDYVKSITLYSEGNPDIDIATYHFTPSSGKAAVAARIRLAKTQNVVAVAEMSTGKFYVGKAQVKVTVVLSLVLTLLHALCWRTARGDGGRAAQALKDGLVTWTPTE